MVSGDEKFILKRLGNFLLLFYYYFLSSLPDQTFCFFLQGSFLRKFAKDCTRPGGKGEKSINHPPSLHSLVGGGGVNKGERW